MVHDEATTERDWEWDERMERMGSGVKPEVPEFSDGPSRILIVEDLPPLRESLAAQIQDQGYEVKAVSTCAEAREAIRDGQFACSLTDLGLPDGNGLDLLAEFRSSAPEMVPIVLTGESDVATVIGALREAAFDYLIKPVDAVTLRASVHRAMTHHAVMRERAVLVELLYSEREQLKRKIEEATADVRAYAKSFERSNALLHSLVGLTQLTAGMMTDESLLRNVYDTVRRHVPLECLALCDVTQRGEFLAAAPEGDDVAIIVSSGDDSGRGVDYAMAMTEPAVFTRFLVERHTGCDTSELVGDVHLQQFWNRPVCIVAFYMSKEFSGDSAQHEFLGMCAHFLAFEWQRARLLQHAAQQASMGNIALELSGSYLQALTAIHTAADLLGETAPSDEDSEGVRIILDNVEYLTDRTKAFHDLSQVREDSVETVRLDEYIDRTLDLLERSVRARGITIEKVFETKSDCVLLNGTALARTFLDIISNAVRSVAIGGAVRLSLREPDPEHIECEISFGASNSTVFGTTARGKPSTIVDLVKGHPSFMLAQRTVHSCGGRLTLARESDARNTFKILLPRNALMSARPTKASSESDE